MTDGVEPDEGEEPTDFASEMRHLQVRLQRVWAADSAENESEGVEMAQLDYGREHLAGTLIMCAFENMTTHAVAAALLASRGVLRVYRLANAEGGPVVSPAFIDASALEALETLAQIGGERVDVDGTEIRFVPAECEGKPMLSALNRIPKVPALGNVHFPKPVNGAEVTQAILAEQARYREEVTVRSEAQERRDAWLHEMGAYRYEPPVQHVRPDVATGGRRDFCVNCGREVFPASGTFCAECVTENGRAVKVEVLLARALDLVRRVARGYDWQPTEVDALEAACKDAGVE